MKVALVTLTTGGVALAKKIAPYFETSVIYTLPKHQVSGVVAMDKPLMEMNRQLFHHYDLLIYIMATGIVVRTLAPYCQHKAQDPGVLVLDEGGKYVISLLSGHLGGANRWAKRVADWIHAEPVITTASDVNDIPAVDEIAEGLQCGVVDFEQAKQVTALMVDKKVVHIVSHVKFQDKPQGLIYIGDDAPKAMGVPYVWLSPKRIVVGVGCQKGVTSDALLRFLKHCCDQIHRPLVAIDKIVSVDLKQEEEGLRHLAQQLKVTFETYSVTTLQTVSHKFKGSLFVQEQIGVSCVSEPAGYLGSYGGSCLLGVQKKSGITLSLWTYEDNDINEVKYVSQ